jgi:hypothetical protein
MGEADDMTMNARREKWISEDCIQCRVSSGRLLAGHNKAPRVFILSKFEVVNETAIECWRMSPLHRLRAPRECA